MLCPHCNTPAAEADQECAKCGFVLAKWKAAQAGAAQSLAAPAPPRVAAPKEEGSQTETILLFGLFLSVALLYFMFFRGDDDSSADSSLGVGACAFSGEVLDIYSLAPASGVKLNFGPKAIGVTNASGRYYMKVRAGETYSPSLASARFKPSYIEGFTRDWRDAEFEQRVRAARIAGAPAEGAEAPKATELKCDSGEERIYNFALVPVSVAEEEKAKIDAVP